MLDRTQPDPGLIAEDGPPFLATDGVDVERPPLRGWQRPLGWLSRAGQFLFTLSFSSLTRRIVSLNIAGLLALVASILYLSQFRAGLIDARAQSLLVQAEIIAGAIAASATVQTNTITIDPERLLDLKPGETYGSPDEYSPLDFPINPERHTCTWKNEPVTLTVTEFLILQALATRPGVVKSRNALMDAAYDDQVYVDDRTIDSHIKRLRKKFKVVDDEFEMIETLYGVGYRFKET